MTFFDERQKHVKESVEKFLRSNLCAQTPLVGKAYQELSKFCLNRGKRVRPLLLMSCYRALGGKKDIMPLAVGIELLHLSTLVHDDVMDEDDERSGTVTVHKGMTNQVKSQSKRAGPVFSSPERKIAASIAILSGNMLVGLGLQSILSFKTQDKTHAAFARAYIDAYQTLNEGQLLDIGTEAQQEVSEREYERVIEKKTATLFVLAYQLASLATGRTQGPLKRALHSYGVAFQLIDDLCDLAPEKMKGRKKSPLKKGNIVVILAKRTGDLLDRLRLPQKEPGRALTEIENQVRDHLKKAASEIHRAEVNETGKLPFTKFGEFLEHRLQLVTPKRA